MTMFTCLSKTLRTKLRLFREEARGSLSLETVLIFPLLAWAYAATFTFFDAFRVQALNTKAAYTISDMLTRVTDEMDQDYLDGLHEIFDYMVQRDGQETWLVLTVVGWDTDTNDYRVIWSRASGNEFQHTTATLDGLKDQIPEIAPGDTLILLETYMDYRTVFDIGLGDLGFWNVVPASPRFAPQLLWQGLNDGGGSPHDDATPDAPVVADGPSI